jgi:glycosidase
MGFSFGPYMPKLNPDNPECREYFINVTKHYLRDYNVDGYRLDVADEVSHNFWREFRKVSKKENPDTLIMGEVWYDSTPYLRGDEFDSIMNYTVYDGIRNFLIGKLSIDQFIDIIERERGETPLNYYHNSNILIGSHDTDRIYTFLNSSKEKFILAMSLLLFIPGSPIIYYGDEIMMEGGQDPDCRRGMIFDNYNQDILKMVKKLIKIKHFEPVREGDISVS